MCQWYRAQNPAYICWFNMKCISSQWCYSWLLFKVYLTTKSHKEAWNTENFSHFLMVKIMLFVTLFAQFFFFSSFFSLVSCYCLLLHWSIKFNFIWLTSTHTSSLHTYMPECRGDVRALNKSFHWNIIYSLLIVVVVQITGADTL